MIAQILRKGAPIVDIAIYTLGCKVNQYETQAMEQALQSRGHEMVDFDGEADAAPGPYPDRL